MKNTAYWEKEFQTFTNTAEERKELICEAFSCCGTQLRKPFARLQIGMVTSTMSTSYWT